MIYGHMYGMHGVLPFVFLFGLSRLLWIALIALLIWSLVRWARMRRAHWNQPMTPYMPHSAYMTGTPPTTAPRPDAPINQPTALEILDRRYANGEIDAATFENMRERILASHGSAQQQTM